VKNKMKKDQFVRNNRGIDDGKDIDKAFMEALYDRIVNNEIRMETAADALKAKAADKSSMSGAQAAATQAARIGLDLLMNLLPGSVPRPFLATPDLRDPHTRSLGHAHPELGTHTHRHSNSFLATWEL
jgi:brefeldin A-inhibited guanine nucleotide-exchange protein